MKKKWIVLLVVAALFLGSLPLSFDFGSVNGDVVTPAKLNFEPGGYPFDTDEAKAEVILDLSKKNVLSLTKYGFRKKIDVENGIFLRLYLQPYSPVFTPYNGLKYGIYHDKELKDPIDEIDLQKQMNRETASDNGIDVKDPRWDMGAELEPGEYYIAVYTTHYWDSFKISFIRYYTEL